MCGICGIFGAADEKLVRAMCDVLKHRGPDDEGYYIDGNICLGNRRLSIIDIKTGHQPIHNEDKTIWITYNGEIYNFQELRKALEKKHSFYTNSDTEVIVHSYEEWGEDCVKRFNGMWAFGIWDSNEQQLFLSRDRFGIKPLYYYWDGKKLVFASEIKAILQDTSITRIPNDRVIYDYLVYAQNDCSEETFFEGIKRLLPAHNMITKRNEITTKKYWDLKISRYSAYKKDEKYAKEFFELLEDSIKLRLISEVPVGTCLSGGLDSSSIVYMISRLLGLGIKEAKHLGKVQKTFSAVYNNKEIDERKYIEEIARATHVEKNYVFPDEEILWKDIRKHVYHQDEPFLGSSIFAQWCVMKLASKKVKVVLDGQGGDELLAGYFPHYYLFYLSDLWKEKRFLRLIKELWFSSDLTLRWVKKFLLLKAKELAGNGAIENTLNPVFVSKFSRTTKNKRKHSNLVESLYLGITKGLPGLLRYEDRNSMAFSIEARVPFLDYRLVEYIFSLPVSQKLRNGWTKYILRNAMDGKLPEEIRKRRRKIGFETPQASWMRLLKNEIREIFTSQEFRERKYFNPSEVLERFDDFCKGKLDDYAKIFWRILNLEIWLEVFF